MTAQYDVVVVGAGIVGAACASAFVNVGMSVAIVEADVIGGGATAAGMGHLVVMDDSPAQMALTAYSVSLWHQLSPELPHQCEHDSCGTIWVASDDDEMAEVERKHAYYTQNGIRTEILTAAELGIAEPNLRTGMAGGLLVTGDGITYPPCTAAYLVGRAVEKGAHLIMGKAVAQIGHGQVQLDNRDVLAAPRIVNAAGAAAGTLTPGLGIKSRKGHLLITDRYPGYVHHQIVELGYLKSAHSLATDSVAFNVQPRKTGQILIGSSRQYDNDNPAVDSAMLSRMLQRAALYMPTLTSLSGIRAWTGFRAATADKLPLIGPWPNDNTVFIAAGHEGLGITTSLATARLLADYFSDKPSAIPIDPYLPARPTEEQPYA